MIKQKKKLSVVLNQAIEPIIREYANIIRIKEAADYQLYLIDADPLSDFHFGISKETSDKNGHFVHWACKPQNAQTNSAISTSGSLETFLQYFKLWLTNIKYYDQESILDDPILRSYEQEYYDDFKIVDENADSSAFSYEQQLLLDGFLDNISDNITAFRNENNAYLIDSIIHERIINEAKRLFYYTDKAAKEIAHELGLKMQHISAGSSKT